ncbi:unnamed protein product [Chrysoparadoxa australica]
MRKRSKETASDPLDTDEQTAIVKDLKGRARDQARLIRNGFAFVCACCSGCIVYSAYFLWRDDLLPHQSLIERYSSIEFHPLRCLALSYLALLACFSSAAAISRGRRRLEPPAYALATVLMVAWGAFFLRQELVKPHTIWIALSAMACLLLGSYIDRDLQGMLGISDELGGLTYQYKKL